MVKTRTESCVFCPRCGFVEEITCEYCNGHFKAGAMIECYEGKHYHISCTNYIGVDNI